MKNKFLKILAILGCLTLSAGFAACGGKGDSGSSNSSGIFSSLEESSLEEIVDSSSEEIMDSSSEYVSNESFEEEYPEEYYTEGLVFTLQDDDTYAVTDYRGTETEVVIPAAYNGKLVISIGKKAFQNCLNLTEVVIPDSVTSIDSFAFDYCLSLTKIVLPDSVTSIGNGAFYDCWSLTEIVLPPFISSIGDYVFSDCESLKELIIPEGVTSIGKEAFWGCYDLTRLMIPNSVTSIRYNAFRGCDSLTIYCEVDSEPSEWIYGWNTCNSPVVWDCNNNEIANDGYIYALIEGVRYALKDNVAMVARQPRNLSTVKIPSKITYKGVTYDVTSMDSYAFNYCDQLTEIIISSSITGEVPLFDQCHYLTIYCEAESQPSGWHSHWNCDNRPVYWYSESEPVTEGNYWHYNDNGEIEIWE